MSDDRRQITYYHLGDPSRPVAFVVPPVEATPERLLPDSGLFLRVCAGVTEPCTVVERIAVELVGMFGQTCEYRSGDPGEMERLNERLNFGMWLIDREAGGYTRGVVCEQDAPLAPSTYGQWAAWLVWKHVVYALRQNDAARREEDAAGLSWVVGSFDEMVAAVRAGRLRLPPEQGPEGDGTEFPPRRVWPDHGTAEATGSS